LVWRRVMPLFGRQIVPKRRTRRKKAWLDRAAAAVLDGQLGMHADLPRDPAGLCELCYAVAEDWVDSGGRFVWVDGEA
jgi:hypothetical protein